MVLTSCMGHVQDDRLLIGTYTDSGAHGIYSLSFDATRGKVSVLDSLQMVNPSFLTVNPDATRIYAVSEQNNDQASVWAIRFDAKSGHMAKMNEVKTLGEDPCFVEMQDDLLLTANYTGGSMTAIHLAEDGSLAELHGVFKGHQSGARPQQQSAHVHTARFFDANTIFATDFSADQILRYRLTADGLTEYGVAGKTPADSGPRHLEWSKNGRTVYAINELSGTVTVFRNRRNQLEPLQTVASDSLSGGGCADIHLSPNGKYLYSSNRLKEDGISIFRVGRHGMLTKVGYQLTGIHPRNFMITPDGRYLLCACRDSDAIQIYSIDTKTGLLTNTHQDIRISKPVCVRYVTTVK